jgi:hypothetical protein
MSDKKNQDISAKTVIVEPQKEGKSYISIIEAGKKEILAIVDDKISQEIGRRVNEATEKLRENLTSNFISTLGIFASIVTFLLIEIQILKNICDYWRLLGFSAFVLGGLIAFIVILHYLVNLNTSSIKTKQLVSLIVVVFALLGFAGFSMSKATDEYTCKLTNLNDEFDRLKSNMEQREFIRFKELNGKIELLEKKIESLNK